jgi:hypothetical protein
VIGDIDHVADPNDPSCLPLNVADLLVNKGVYSEVSPSGEGIRFVLVLPEVENKMGLRGKVFYTRTPLVDKRECQINFGPPWLRFTGNETPYSSGQLSVVALAELDEVFAVKYKSDDPLAEIAAQDGEVQKIQGVSQDTPSQHQDEKLPTLPEFVAALDMIPLDQSPRIVRSYEKVFSQTYSHYDFWLRIIMGVHDFATKTGTKMECIQRVMDWSKTDPASFSSEEDVLTKWMSLDQKEENVSFHTVMAIAYHHSLIWPKPKALSKAQQAQGITTREPINSEYANFRALVDFYGIELHRDAHAPAKMYLSGDDDAMKGYFASRDTTYYYEKYRGIFDEKNLIASMHIMAQEKGFTGLSHQHTKQHIANWTYQITNHIDLVRLYFDTPFEDLPESYQDNKEHHDISTIETMFNCLTIEHLTADTAKENRLYFKYFKSWLMGMVRNLFFPNNIHSNNCILLLSGKEQIRKTSFFKFMLPKFMRDERIAFTTHGFGNANDMRDNIKLASGNTLMVWDEIEQHLSAETESNFKQLIDSSPTKFIDKYATIESSYKPVAIYGGTSNQREFKLSDTGSRRLFHIPISWADTDTLDKICWWRIVNDLRVEMDKWKGGDPPWLLTHEELGYQATLHSKITAQSSLEIVIREVFNFNEPCFVPNRTDTIEMGTSTIMNHPQFMSTKKVIDKINIHTSNQVKVPRAQLMRIMHNLCGAWTGTTNKSRMFTAPRIRIERGMSTYAGQHQRWVVPSSVNPYG